MKQKNNNDFSSWPQVIIDGQTILVKSSDKLSNISIRNNLFEKGFLLGNTKIITGYNFNNDLIEQLTNYNNDLMTISKSSLIGIEQPICLN